MPRGSRAFILAEIRTLRRREPAGGDALLGFSPPLQSIPETPRSRLPDSDPPALPTSDPEGSDAQHSKALADVAVDRPLSGTTSSLEVFHQGPILGFPRRQWCPSG
jgi:hypothetical protein